jgi:hypothetical protein
MLTYTTRAGNGRTVRRTRTAFCVLVWVGVLALSWNAADAQPMACCLPSGSCELLSNQDCSAVDGVISEGTLSCEGLECVGCCFNEGEPGVCEDPVPAAVCINGGGEFGIGVCSNGSGNPGGCASARTTTAPALGWPGLAILTVLLVWITSSKVATRLHR